MKTKEQNQEYIFKDQKHLWHSMHRFNLKNNPLIASIGEGSWVSDIDGNKYLDGISGLWCLNLGYGREDIAIAAYEQLKDLAYFPLSQSHKPAIDLSVKLSEILGGEYTTYFSNSGSEANETAFKIARQYHSQTGNPGKYKIIARYRAYHGTTLGALSATAQANRKVKYDPLMPGFLHVPPPYSYRNPFGVSGEESDMMAADYLEQVIVWEGPDSVAAVIMEPIISGGGVLVPSPEYMKRVQEICQKYNVLLIADEVVSGFGRTGKMFGFMHSEGVQPDIVTMAKGITAGYLPLGATSVKSEIYEKFRGNHEHDHFRHVSTFGGHPAACRVALEVIDIIEKENICSKVAVESTNTLSQLHQLEAEFPIVGEVRGVGFLYGIEFVEDKETKEPVSDETMNQILGKCKELGLILNRNGDTVPGYGNIMIIAPPLTSTEDDLKFVVKTVKTAIASVLS